MDSLLSGYSNSYGGTQISQGVPGTVTAAAPAGTGSSAQGVDVTQLQPGDTFQGEIVSVNGEDVQLQLSNGQYMAAKLERDVQLALGQIMNLQVQSNKDNHIVLKPVYDRFSQMLRVGEMALRAAHLAVNDKNLALVSKLLENGMSIDKNTLMTFNRLTLQHPQTDLADLVTLTKMRLPVTDSSLAQLGNYHNMEHRLLDGIKEASEEILKLYDSLTGNQTAQGMAGGGQTALEAGGRFMEQVLTLLAGEEGQNTQSVPAGMENGADQNIPADAGNAGNSDGQTATAGTVPGQEQAGDHVPPALKQEGAVNANTGTQQDSRLDAAQTAGNAQEDIHTVLSRLKGEKPQALPDRIAAYIGEGKLGLKDVKQLLTDTELGKMMTAQQKAKIFHSEPFKAMLRNSLQKRWTLTPQELTQEGRIEEFYQKLAKESSQLSRMMNEAMQSGGQNANAAQTRAMGNISENVEFMNQMNQMFNYVQLPLKLGNSQAHGDLYVYTNKKNMARRDGVLTAFLHLDMDHLGPLDVSITLQTEQNQVTTKFYLDEDSVMLVEKHIDELAQRLAGKGYQCKNMVLEKEKEKTVMEHIEEQVAGGSAVLSYQTFDTRA